MSSSDSDEMPLDYVTLLDDVISKVSDSVERLKLQASFDYWSDGTGYDGQLQSEFMKTLQRVLDAQAPQVMEETKNAVDGPKSSKQPTELKTLRDHGLPTPPPANTSIRKR